MVVTGIIREINVSKEDSQLKNNLYVVEIPLFTMTGAEQNDVFTTEATACLPGGIYTDFEVDDMVYIGFIEDELTHPVILGKIYKGVTDESRGYYKIADLEVTGRATLPEDTKFGSYTVKNIVQNQQNISNLNTLTKVLDEAAKDKYLYKDSSGKIMWKEGTGSGGGSGSNVYVQDTVPHDVPLSNGDLWLCTADVEV